MSDLLRSVATSHTRNLSAEGLYPGYRSSSEWKDLSLTFGWAGLLTDLHFLAQLLATKPHVTQKLSLEC